jgi:hypothetical protein
MLRIRHVVNDASLPEGRPPGSWIVSTVREVRRKLQAGGEIDEYDLAARTPDSNGGIGWHLPSP